jgi:hypothetical protein
VTGRVRSIEKSSDLIGNQTRDLLDCSIVLQPAVNLPNTCEKHYCLIQLARYVLIVYVNCTGAVIYIPAFRKLFTLGP